MQWMTIFKKELLGDWRSMKWIWVPLVFILLCIMDPLMTYFMPRILDSVGGMPEGAVIEFPEVPPTEAIMMSLTELSMFGSLLIAAITMSVIAGERKSGVAELILVKPVNYFSYITSKWAAKLFLIFISYSLGMLASWYYVDLLFGGLSAEQFFGLFIFYFIWLIFTVTVAIFYNTIFKRPGIVLAASVGTYIALSILAQVFANRSPWFPNNISSHIRSLMASGEVSSDLWIAAGVTVGISIILLIASNFSLRKAELAE